MSKLISIETKRYSEFFRRLLAEYADGTTVVIDGREFSRAEVVSTWCRNTVICRTRDFLLKRGDVEVCGFHDHPRETWVVESELSFVQRLAAEQVIRFRILNCAK